MWSLFAACASAPALPPPAVEPPPPAPAPPPALEVEPPDGAFSRELLPGLTIAAHLPPPIPEAGYHRAPEAELAGCDPRIWVVTVDPARYALQLATVLDPEIGGSSRTGPAWARERELLVAFNPGMFEPDDRGTGYTRAGQVLTQPEVRRGSLYRGWFLAEPRADTPAVTAVDRVPNSGPGTWGPLAELPQDFRGTLDRYDLAIQSLPILRGGAPAYPARERQWSELAFGSDDQGRLLIVFSRWPYEMREFGARVAALGIGARDLIHGEGGPEATLAVRAGGVAWVRVGSFETGFADDANHHPWPLPGVLGVVAR